MQEGRNSRCGGARALGAGWFPSICFVSLLDVVVSRLDLLYHHYLCKVELYD